MPVTRITEAMQSTLESSIARHAGEDTILWDAAFQVLPGPDQSLMGTVALYVQMPGVVPKTYVGVAHLLQPVLDEQVIDENVRQVVESLRASRSRQLQAMQTEAENAARSGRAAPSGGLIAP